MGDLSYPEARREARKILGQHSDVMKFERAHFPAVVGVYSETMQGHKEFIVVGAGATYAEALEDAKKRQQA